MASIRYFLGWTQTQLETALEAARTDLVNGSTLASGGASDSTFGYAVQLTPQRRIELLLEELCLLNPTKYPPATTLPTKILTGLFRDR